MYRWATAANPAVFALDLVEALSDLAGMLSELGQREQALAATEEEAQASRELAAANPAVFGSDLAYRLRALSGMLSDLGRREEAQGTGQEAVQAFRELAAANPAVFAPDLANALSNLSADLLHAGLEDPFTAAEQIFRAGVPLARQNGLVFIVSFRDRDDATGIAQLLADVRLSQPESKTVFLAPPVGGLEFSATDTSPVGWYYENVPANSAVVYILDHETGLGHRLQGIPGTFYVGVPDLSLGQGYSGSVRVVVTRSPLDVAAVIMRDYSHPTSLHGVIFDGCGSCRGTGSPVIGNIGSVCDKSQLMTTARWHWRRSSHCGGRCDNTRPAAGRPGACVKRATVSRLELRKASKTTGGGGRGTGYSRGSCTRRG